jgi:hypothetical protein
LEILQGHKSKFFLRGPKSKLAIFAWPILYLSLFLFIYKEDIVVVPLLLFVGNYDREIIIRQPCIRCFQSCIWDKSYKKNKINFVNEINHTRLIFFNFHVFNVTLGVMHINNRKHHHYMHHNHQKHLHHSHMHVWSLNTLFLIFHVLNMSYMSCDKEYYIC